MLCCVGLIAGISVGQSLGGPWAYIAPAAGFGIGFLADMKLMKGMHKKGVQVDNVDGAKKDAGSVPAMQAEVIPPQSRQSIAGTNELPHPPRTPPRSSRLGVALARSGHVN